MRKSFRALGVAFVLAFALVILVAASALAASTHVFTTSFGEPGSGAGQMELRADINNRGSGISGIAVNATTHDVYIADTGNHRVDQFSSAGVFIRAWGWGVADGLPVPETCTLSCQAGIAGSGPGQIIEPIFVAVDNSGGPSEGDVYVVDASVQHNTVSKFSASGTYLSSNNGSGATAPISGPFALPIVGIAVDGSGDLWVGVEGSTIHFPAVYEFAQDGVFTTGWQVHTTLLPFSGIAVDSVGNIYIAVGGGGVTKFTSGGGQIGAVKGGYENIPSGFVVDPSTNDIYVAEHGEVSHYPAPCDPLKGPCAVADSFGQGSLSTSGPLAFDPTYGTVYAVDPGVGRVAVFDSTPDLDTGQSANRTPTAALLSGTVNPHGIAVSDCHFDYVADAEYAPGEPDPYAAGLTAPCVPAPGAGSSPVAVQAELTGLTPGVTYHFRLQATNANGTNFGSDQTVPGSAPLIDSTGVADISSTSANFHAQINPGGGDTTYRFEYGTSTGYGADAPVPDGDIGHETSDVAVSQHIQGLAANTLYHYRLVVHNPLGTVDGPDHTILTQPIGGGGSDACPNAALRAGQHAGALPDCRAYEQVSPPEKNGGQMNDLWQGSLDGNGFGWTSSQAFGDAQSAASLEIPYLSARTQSGWTTHALLPPQEPGLVFPNNDSISLYSSDLFQGIQYDGSGSAQDEPPLVPGEPAHNQNLFLRDNRNDTYQLIDVTPAGVTPAAATLLAASPDLSHAVFAENAQLTADSPPAGEFKHVFEWSAGTVHLLGVMPNGTAVPATLEVSVPKNHGISDDGSRIFFSTRGSVGGEEALYLRQNGTSTVQLDASHGSGPGGDGQFAVASDDGSVAYFTDRPAAGLTNDTVSGSGENLYRYDAGSGTLTDLTPAANAEVLGVLGASSDGSYVYFVANGDLAAGASPGDCPSSQAGFGSCNLYLAHNGVTRFVTTLAGSDVRDWAPHLFSATFGSSVVSADGRRVAFDSVRSITGYDNTDANTGQPDTEVFLYDALSGLLSCASCNPSGAAPIGESIIHGPPVVGAESDAIQSHPLRYLAEGGRLFFNSRDSLSLRDANSRWDVYEYEPDGLGNCAQASGCVSLISSGISPQDSVFHDSSVTGDDVFFTTTDQLVAQDTDVIYDYYDARVGGGIAAQNQSPAASCGDESCKPPASDQPLGQTLSSIGFSGAGNPAPSAPLPVHKKAAKKKHTKKKHPAKKRRHPKRHPARGRQANHNRRGAK